MEYGASRNKSHTKADNFILEFKIIEVLHLHYKD